MPFTVHLPGAAEPETFDDEHRFAFWRDGSGILAVTGPGGRTFYSPSGWSKLTS